MYELYELIVGCYHNNWHQSINCPSIHTQKAMCNEEISVFFRVTDDWVKKYFHYLLKLWNILPKDLSASSMCDWFKMATKPLINPQGLINHESVETDFRHLLTDGL